MKPEHEKIIDPTELLRRHPHGISTAFDWSRDFKTKSGCAVQLCGQLPYEEFGPFNRVGCISAPLNDNGDVQDHLTRWHDSGANIEKREWSLVNVPREYTYTVFIVSLEGCNVVTTNTFRGVVVKHPDPHGVVIHARHTFTIKEGEFSA